MNRQSKFRDQFTTNMAVMKTQYGHGGYSWTEGMTRRLARSISRDLARKNKSVPSRVHQRNPNEGN